MKIGRLNLNSNNNDDYDDVAVDDDVYDVLISIYVCTCV